MKIGIIGIGNVGFQVLKDIQSNSKINKFLNIEKILVRDKDKYLKILESEFGVDWRLSAIWPNYQRNIFSCESISKYVDFLDLSRL